MTRGLISGRRLPQTPTEGTYSNGRYSQPYNNGIQVDVRPPAQQNPYYRPGTGSSTQDTPTVNMPMPMPDPNNGGTWRPSTGQSDVSGRYSNSRPPTVSSHTQRGPYENGYDDSPYRSPDFLDDMYSSPDGYGPADVSRQDTSSSHRRANSHRSFQAAGAATSLYAGAVCE